MSRRTFFSRIGAWTRFRRNVNRSRVFRPLLEALEDRRLLSPILQIVARLTGTPSLNNTSTQNIGGTDLGITANYGGKTYFLFGDTFSGEDPAAGGNWRRNTMAWTTDTNPADGIVFDDWLKTVSNGYAKQAFTDNAPTGSGVITNIPTGAIAANGNLYAWFMNVNQWGPAGGEWYISQAELAKWGGGNSTFSIVSGNTYASDSNFGMVAAANGADGDPYLYLFGTRAGRFGPGIKLARFLPANIENKASYEYFDGFMDGQPTWTTSESNGDFVVTGSTGEMSVMYNNYLQAWTMMYFNEISDTMEIRQASAPWGPWAAPVTVMTPADCPSGTYGIYAPYMNPLWVEDGGQTVYFTFSLWFPYDVWLAKVTLNAVSETLYVTQFLPTSSGFVARFSRVLEPSVLNLYDSALHALGAADIAVTGATVGPVRGSLVVSADRRQIAFVATGGLLEPDTYTVTLFSGATRFREPTGGTLDGNADDTPGDDYQTTFTVAARPAGTVVASVPDMARGAGQAVNIPNTVTGVPLCLDNADGVTSLAVDLRYDPALLSITGATLASGIPTGWSVGLDTSTSGVARITASGTTPLSGTNVDVVRLTATVPSDAPYGAVQAIRLENAAFNGGAIAAIGDVAVHKAAYLGDADGSGIHSSADAFLTVQAALGLASGFAAHVWADPRIVGDADGSGVLSAADAFLIVQEGLGLSEPFVPDNPHIAITPVGGGIDPQFQIGESIPAAAGGVVTIPVQLDVDPAATNVGALDFDLFFDPAQLTIHGGIVAGTDTASGWAITSSLLSPGHLRVGMISSWGEPLAVGLREIARLQFYVAVPGVTPLDIEPVDPRAGGYVWTAVNGSVAADGGRDQLFADLATESSPLEGVLSDLADDVAGAWL